MELWPVNAHVQIVEPARRRPAEACADGEGAFPRRVKGIAGGQQFIPGFNRRFNANFLKQRGAVVNRPPVVGGRQEILPVIDGCQRLEARGIHFIEALFLPHIGEIQDQAAINKEASAIPGEPGEHVRRRFGSQVRAQRLLEVFMGDDGVRNGLIGVRLVPHGDHPLVERARQRVAGIRIVGNRSVLGNHGHDGQQDSGQYYKKAEFIEAGHEIWSPS